MSVLTEEMKNAATISVTSLPSYWIDGICGVAVIGEVMRVTNFEFRRYEGALVKMPVLEIIRPASVDITAQIMEFLRSVGEGPTGRRLQH